MRKEASVLFAVSVLTNGGAERVVAALASGMADAGIKTSILLNRRCENEYPVSDKVSIYSLPQKYAASGNIIHKVKKAFSRYLLIKKIDPDVVLAFLDGVIEPTFLSCLALKKKFIPSIRVAPQIGSKWRRMIRDIIIACSTACFVQNMEQKSYFSKRIQKKTFVVPNPVSDSFIAKPRVYNPKTKIIVNVGRLRKQKNQRMLILAMEQIKAKHPGLLLKIFGEGTEQDALNELICSHGLEGVVQLCGRSENMRAVYEEADVFVLSSDFEGMPNALMEAMSMGLPCISTDCPTGPKDLIEDMRNGMLIPVGDLKQLVKRLEQLCEDVELRQALGENARRDIQKKYKTDIIVRKLYEEISRYMQNG